MRVLSPLFNFVCELHQPFTQPKKLLCSVTGVNSTISFDEHRSTSLLLKQWCVVTVKTFTEWDVYLTTWLPASNTTLYLWYSISWVLIFCTRKFLFLLMFSLWRNRTTILMITTQAEKYLRYHPVEKFSSAFKTKHACFGKSHIWIFREVNWSNVAAALSLYDHCMLDIVRHAP